MSRPLFSGCKQDTVTCECTRSELASWTLHSAIAKKQNSPPYPPGLFHLAATETPVTAAGWVNHQQAVGNGRRHAPHHPVPGNIIIILVITFKGAVQDFLQSPHSAANCLQHVRSSGPGAIVCKSCATHRALITCKRHVTYHLVWRDSSAIKFDRVEIAFIWALFYWLNHYSNEGGEETGVPRENPWQWASENATYYSQKIQTPSETWTLTVALVAG